MLPLSDGLPSRRFPVVNVTLIVANFAVWPFYELPNLNSAIFHASFYPCTVDGACHGPLPSRDGFTSLSSGISAERARASWTCRSTSTGSAS